MCGIVGSVSRRRIALVTSISSSLQEMKNQYFGDDNDYLKYGLLRALLEGNALNAIVVWMLTPDNGGTDGRKRRYLHEPNIWRRLDPVLYDGLVDLLGGATSTDVAVLEKSNLLPRTSYYSETVPDDSADRERWSSDLRRFVSAVGADLVFLDPDNGLQVPSRPIGGTGSSKYASWRDVASIWENGQSLLIYQHYPPVAREEYTRQKVAMLRSKTRANQIFALRTSSVLFLLACQPEHERQLLNAIANNLPRWSGKIEVMDLVKAKGEHAITLSAPFANSAIPACDANGVILNAAVLTDRQVVNQRVLCPCCGEKTFEKWPLGWDAHATHRCSGLRSSGETERKAEFKKAFRNLFRA